MEMRKTLGIFFLLLLLNFPLGLAPTYDQCSPDNSTLIHVRQAHIDVPERNISRTLDVTENETCPAGCDPERNVCNYPTWIYWLIIMGVAVGAYLAFKFIIIPMVSR